MSLLDAVLLSAQQFVCLLISVCLCVCSFISLFVPMNLSVSLSVHMSIFFLSLCSHSVGPGISVILDYFNTATDYAWVLPYI